MQLDLFVHPEPMVLKYWHCMREFLAPKRCYCARCRESRLTWGPMEYMVLWTEPKCVQLDNGLCIDSGYQIVRTTWFGRALPL